MESRPVDRVQPDYAAVRQTGDTAGKADKRQSNGDFQKALKQRAAGKKADGEEQRKRAQAAIDERQSEVSNRELRADEEEGHLLDVLA